MKCFAGDVLRRLRRYLADEDDPAAKVVEVGLRLVLGYVVIGFVYTVLHIELVDQLENALSAQFTVFADYAALAVMVLMWPLLLASAWICGISGCGLIG
ncbi:addiction module protein [Mycobacterium sp. TJFP1]|uniref:addiction module protein n=1 Tax=Mycolicibacterium TaxID=1866885 RepID=UPI00298C0204|nr:addiction module protein [Mycolicibacterium sp. D5.8-2]MDW5611606.1 addiction module protein [Mycolicibacterium sp. D5.8-2]